ncbi:MFS transporter [Anaeromyxobacter paludicola]|uniref:MFS transporter n=1 Tax=Anaeromyxobacter paludicola TaxID=2918171 RepID=UPI0020C0145F|nr:MFS transporter [Anaeromyxobacter paludicola]
MRGLPATAWLLGLASLLNDVSSEAIFPLLPLLLTQVLAGGMRYLGAVEGGADALAAAVKVAAGRWSDRGPRRLLVAGGYGLPALARAGIAAALAPWHVLAARLLDRLGKGIRSGPRDALLSDAVAGDDVGRAFGLQRSMDHLGAAIGPLLAAGLLAAGVGLRATFWIAAALGMAAPALLLRGLREPRAGAGAGTGSPRAGAPPPAPLPAPLRRYLVLAALFAMGNSTDAFLLAKARLVGYPAATLPLLWFGHHLVKTLTGAPGGALSDRLPRGLVVAGGWTAYALAYAGFSVAGTRLEVALLFGFYALYHGLTEGAERALVADLAPAGGRGRAFGWYYGAAGAAALPAGLLTGWLWEARGPAVALGTCAAFAGAAAALLLATPALHRTQPAGPAPASP